MGQPDQRGSGGGGEYVTNGAQRGARQLQSHDDYVQFRGCTDFAADYSTVRPAHCSDIVNKSVYVNVDNSINAAGPPGILRVADHKGKPPATLPWGGHHSDGRYILRAVQTPVDDGQSGGFPTDRYSLAREPTVFSRQVDPVNRDEIEYHEQRPQSRTDGAPQLSVHTSRILCEVKSLLCLTQVGGMNRGRCQLLIIMARPSFKEGVAVIGIATVMAMIGGVSRCLIGIIVTLNLYLLVMSAQRTTMK